MDCVILAGGIPGPADPLYIHTQGNPKALLPFDSATMIEYVVEALIAAESIHNITIVGMERLDTRKDPYPLLFIPNQGSLVDNALAGAESLLLSGNNSSHALFCTSDIPMINGPIVDRFIASCYPLDCAAYYSMVTRETMEARFPESGRTFVNLGNNNFAGGDLVVARPDLAKSNREILQMLASGRKHAWKLAQIVGLSTLLKFLFHRLTIGDIEKKAQSVLGNPIKVIISNDAELAMDVDNPDHLSLLRRHLNDSD